MSLASVAAVLLLSPIAAAQTRPGVSFDQTITSVASSAGHYDSSTNVVHTTSNGSEVRMEMSNTSSMPRMGSMGGGSPAIIIMRDAGKQMLFLNPEDKEYMSMKPFDMIDAAKKMLESMGGTFSFDSSASTIRLDSIGPGQTIDGHPTLHYRLTTAVKVNVSMMGESMGIEDRSTSEIDAATDLADLRDFSMGVGEAAAGFSQTMSFAGDFFQKAAAAQKKMRGYPLRIVKHSTQSHGGTTNTITETIQTRNIKQINAPDSLFAIPAGYKPVSMPMPRAGVENLP
jgi:hypothetical protein